MAEISELKGRESEGPGSTDVAAILCVANKKHRTCVLANITLNCRNASNPKCIQNATPPPKKKKIVFLDSPLSKILEPCPSMRAFTVLVYFNLVKSSLSKKQTVHCLKKRFRVWKTLCETGVQTFSRGWSN